MAIYHLSTKPVSRSSGRSAVASIAYRAGIEITDERTGKNHDYTKRSGVVETSLHMPQDFKGDKLEQVERSKLWNMAERKETRSNSRTAREIVVNLPHELSKNERSELVNNFANEIADKYQIAVDVAIHTPDKEGDNRNHHAHLLMTTRKLERMEDGSIALTEKSQLEMSNTQLKERNLPTAQQELKDLRKTWADRTNHALERAGREERIDHRSHKDRGLDIKPTVKMGWQATKLERMGIRTEVGDINRQIKADNAEIMGLKAEIIVNREKLEQQTAKKAPNRSTEPRKEKRVSDAPQRQIEELQQVNTAQIEGQTPEQAREYLHQYDTIVKAKGEQLRKQELAKLTEKMNAIASKYNALKKEGDSLGGGMKKLLGGKSKHSEQLEQLEKQHGAVKRHKAHAERASFKEMAIKAMDEHNPQSTKDHEQARETLNAHAGYKYGSQEGRSGRQYTGEITKVSRLGVIQTTATGKQIYHELESLDKVPSKGEKVKITYGDKTAKVDMADRSELARQQQEHQQQMEQRKESKGMER